VVNLETGQLVASAKKKTRLLSDEENIVKRLHAVVDDALNEAKMSIEQLKGIGIGVAGMINRQKGILLAAPNLGVKDLLLAEPISKHYGVPCRVCNDVEAATYGEQFFGAGRNCDSFVCVFVGTGIGSGIEIGRAHV